MAGVAIGLMFARRSGWRRCLGIISLATLLLVPVVLSGHRHAEHASTARPCAVCVVAHHAPLLGVAIVTSVGLALRAFVQPLTPTAAPTVHHRSPAAGRAPPLAIAIF